MLLELRLNPAFFPVSLTLVLSCCLLSTNELTAATPLFTNHAAESFYLVDIKTKKPPKITVLNADPLEISLAAIVGRALQLPADDDGLTLKLERLEFSPITAEKNTKASDPKLSLRARVSGREFDLEPTLSAADFKKGRLITVRFPKQTNDGSVATIISSGEVQLKYDSATDSLEIPHGRGELSYDSKLGLKGERKLNFVAHGTRVLNEPSNNVITKSRAHDR